MKRNNATKIRTREGFEQGDRWIPAKPRAQIKKNKKCDAPICREQNAKRIRRATTPRQSPPKPAQPPSFLLFRLLKIDGGGGKVQNRLFPSEGITKPPSLSPNAPVWTQQKLKHTRQINTNHRAAWCRPRGAAPHRRRWWKRATKGGSTSCGGRKRKKERRKKKKKKQRPYFSL